MGLRSQTICDSVFIQPAVFYLNQAADTLVYDTLTYIGQRDISYSLVYFKFQDSTYMTIHDNAVTNGVSGPFTFSNPFGYKVNYKMPNIPASTVVNAHYGVYHAGMPAPIIDCLLPVTFIINGASAIQFAHTGGASEIYPNPFARSATVQLGCLVRNATVSIYNATGKMLRRLTNFSGSDLVLERGDLAEGIYFLHAVQGDKLVAKHKFAVTD